MKAKLFYSVTGVIAALSFSALSATAQDTSEAKPVVPPVSAQTEPAAPSDPAMPLPVNPDSIAPAAPALASAAAMDDVSPDAAVAATADMTTETTILAPKDFIQQAWLANEFTAAAGATALEKSQDAETKATAQKLIDEAGKVRSDMVAAVGASTSDMTFTQAWDEAYKARLLALTDADAATFDATYLDTQADVTADATELFEAYAKTGSDEATKTFAANTLPMLQTQATEVDMAANAPDGSGK